MNGKVSKTPPEVLSDIGSAFGFACRVALDFGVSKETLHDLLDAAHDVAAEIRKKIGGRVKRKIEEGKGNR
jgi:hypothetical protein